MRVWLARLCIAIVFFANVQCAIAFITQPSIYTSAYELSGVIGVTMLQAIGLLFLMWNVPYAVALWHPVRNLLSLGEAVAMQAIGVVGELILTAALPEGHPILHASLVRFIWFDGCGLLLLIIASWMCFPHRKALRG